MKTVRILNADIGILDLQTRRVSCALSILHLFPHKQFVLFNPSGFKGSRMVVKGRL